MQTDQTQNNEATKPATETSASLIQETPAIDLSTKPEWLPDDAWDKEKNTPILERALLWGQTAHKRAEGLRVKLSKGEFDGKAPEDIKEYTLTLDEKLKPLVPDDDPIVNTLRQSAKEAGMPKDMFDKLLVPAIAKLAELKGESETPPTPEEIEADRQAEIAKLGPSGERIVNAVGSFIKELQASGTLSEAEAVKAKEMAYDADAIRVLNKLRMRAGGRDSVPVDVPIDSKASRGDIETKMAQAMLLGNEAEYAKYSGMLARLNMS